ncbi:hypothetical protein ACTXT7_002675 [Hymenolepis weldensis]
MLYEEATPLPYIRYQEANGPPVIEYDFVFPIKLRHAARSSMTCKQLRARPAYAPKRAYFAAVTSGSPTEPSCVLKLFFKPLNEDRKKIECTAGRRARGKLDIFAASPAFYNPINRNCYSFHQPISSQQ